MNKGPLIRVKRAGVWIKMYTEDAIEQGLIAGQKAQPKSENKMAPAAANKAAVQPAVVADFTTISGVGKAAARSIVAQGITTLDGLRVADLNALNLTKKAAAAIEEWRSD